MRIRTRWPIQPNWPQPAPPTMQQVPPEPPATPPPEPDAAAQLGIAWLETALRRQAVSGSLPFPDPDIDHNRQDQGDQDEE